MAGRSFSGRALLYMAAQISANVVGAVTSMVLARVFTQQEYGDYLQLMYVYTLFSGILIMGLPSSLTYFYSVVEEEKKAAAVYIVMLLLFGLGMLLGAVTFFTAPLVAHYFHDNERLAPLVRDFFLFYAFTLGGSYIRRLLVAANRYKFLMFYLPFDRVMMLLSFAVPALLGWGLENAVKVAVYVAAFKFAMTTFYTIKILPHAGVIWENRLAVKILAYSVPLGLSAAVGGVSKLIDRGLIGRYEDTTFFAVYSVGALALPFVGEISESVMTVLIPELARLYKQGEKAQFLKIWQESIRKTSVFVLGTMGFIMFFATPVIVALYGERYAESALYFRLYQVALLMRVTLYGHVLQAIGQTRQILYASVILVLLKVGTNLTLYKALGPTGPPLGSLALAFGLFFYMLFFIGKQLGFKMGRLWPWAAYFKVLAAALAAGLVGSAALLVPDAMLSSYAGRISEKLVRPDVTAAIKLVLGMATFLPVYLAALHISGALQDKDWQRIKAMTYGRFVKK